MSTAILPTLVTVILLKGGCLAGIAAAPGKAEAAWSPPGELRSVRVRYDCNMTRHGIGVAVQPNLVYPHGAIFLCPERAQRIETSNPGASLFFLVHEYGHLALRTRDEAAADDWAADQLKDVPGGRRVLSATVTHFVQRPNLFDPLYGSNLDRALRVAKSGGLPRQDWPVALVAYQHQQELETARATIVRLELEPGYVNQAEMILVVDGRAVGYLSTQPPSSRVFCAPWSGGIHEIEAADVWLYHRESGQKRPVEIGRNLSTTCKLEGGAAKCVVLTLTYDEDLRLKAGLR